MRKFKILFPVVIFAAALMLTGCGQNTEESSMGGTYDEQKESSEAVLSSAGQNESGQTDEQVVSQENVDSKGSQAKDGTSSFLFQVSTCYVIGDKNFDGGPVMSGTIKTGNKAVLVKSDGTSYEVRIERIAQYQRDEDEKPTSLDAAEEGSFVYVWLENNRSNEGNTLWHGNLLLGTTEWEYGIPEEFPFEESEEYVLAFAPQEEETGQGEFRLYDRDGVVLQRIPYGTYELPYYFILHRNDRNSLVFYSDEGEKEVKCLEWDDGQFSESEIDIKPDMTITEETEKRLVRELYGLHGKGRMLERTRRFTLRKDTGKFEIWDDLAGENIFRGELELNKDGNPGKSGVL